MKHKILVICIAVILAAGSFAAYFLHNSAESDGKDHNTKKIRIVTTIFPVYDWVNNILGDNAGNAEISMLTDDGIDLHSYQPSSEDIEKISKCDMFIHVGGESDEWVKDAVKSSGNKKMVVINLIDKLGNAVKNEETVEGMQAEDEHDEEHSHDEEAEKDEHIWLSLRNASFLTKIISDELIAIDKDNGKVYKNNALSYIKELQDLDSQYKKAVSNASNKTLLFGDRFPFRYMTEDYGLSYYAAFKGCSSESDASFETVVFLAKKTDELSLSSILTIEKSDKKIAKAIIKNTKGKNQKILTMDSMQSVTSKEADGDHDYLSVMKSNLEVLKKALD